MKWVAIALALLMFSAGFIAAELVQFEDTRNPIGTPDVLAYPHDYIQPADIKVFDEKVVIDVPGLIYAPVSGSYSMGDLLPPQSHTLEMVPQSESELAVGDIISFFEPSINAVAVHKIVGIGHDKYGWFAQTQGTNNKESDPWTVRFPNVKGKLVGVLI